MLLSSGTMMPKKIIPQTPDAAHAQSLQPAQQTVAPSKSQQRPSSAQDSFETKQSPKSPDAPRVRAEARAPKGTFKAGDMAGGRIDPSKIELNREAARNLETQRPTRPAAPKSVEAPKAPSAPPKAPVVEAPSAPNPTQLKSPDSTFKPPVGEGSVQRPRAPEVGDGFKNLEGGKKVLGGVAAGVGVVTNGLAAKEAFEAGRYEQGVARAAESGSQGAELTATLLKKAASTAAKVGSGLQIVSGLADAADGVRQGDLGKVALGGVGAALGAAGFGLSKIPQGALALTLGSLAHAGVSMVYDQYYSNEAQARAARKAA